jgi:flagellar protein FliO/FliZ
MNTRTARTGFRSLLAPLLVIGVLVAGGGTPAVAAADSAAQPATAEPAANPPATNPPTPRTAKNVVPGGDLDSMSGPLTRMLLSLLAVLAVLGVCAWLARRVRGTQIQGGLIQIVSGLSLGPKEKVVLLRVGDDQVLVGLSAAGMQALHVVGKTRGAGFSLSMADTAEIESLKRQTS